MHDDVVSDVEELCSGPGCCRNLKSIMVEDIKVQVPLSCISRPAFSPEQDILSKK